MLYSVIEVEKIGKKQRQTILYAGENRQDAEFVRFRYLRPYHTEKTQSKDGFVVFFLIVD